MLLDTLNNVAKLGLGERFSVAFQYLQDTDFTRISPGKYKILDDNVYSIVQHYDSKPKSSGLWESHRQYIDVQYVAQGAEQVGYAYIETLNPGVYDEAKDLIRYEAGGGEFFLLQQGFCAVFWPQDGHMPGIAIATPAPVVKAVVKIRII
jgi:YhcH/YjgK/YiaL family protein